jgi:hypothetical protein
MAGKKKPITEYAFTRCGYEPVPQIGDIIVLTDEKEVDKYIGWAYAWLVRQEARLAIVAPFISPSPIIAPTEEEQANLWPKGNGFYRWPEVRFVNQRYDNRECIYVYPWLPKEGWRVSGTLFGPSRKFLKAPQIEERLRECQTWLRRVKADKEREKFSAPNSASSCNCERRRIDASIDARIRARYDEMYGDAMAAQRDRERQYPD